MLAGIYAVILGADSPLMRTPVSGGWVGWRDTTTVTHRATPPVLIQGTVAYDDSAFNADKTETVVTHPKGIGISGTVDISNR